MRWCSEVSLKKRKKEGRGAYLEVAVTGDVLRLLASVETRRVMRNHVRVKVLVHAAGPDRPLQGLGLIASQNKFEKKKIREGAVGGISARRVVWWLGRGRVSESPVRFRYKNASASYLPRAVVVTDVLTATALALRWERVPEPTSRMG
jgi:hypothetical protein